MLSTRRRGGSLAYHPGRHTTNDGIGRYITCDNRTRGNDRMLSDAHATRDDYVGPDPHPFANADDPTPMPLLIDRYTGLLVSMIGGPDYHILTD